MSHRIGVSWNPARCAGVLAAGRRIVVLSGLAAIWACGSGTEPSGGGTIDVTTATTGMNPDADGYSIVVDGGAPQPIGANATLTVSDLTTGDHSVQLAGLATNCTLGGDNPRTVTVTTDAAAQATFAVTCGAPAGAIEVTTTSSGSPPDADGYSVVVDGGAPQAIGANAAVTVSSLAPGNHTVELGGLANNCAVSDQNPRTITVAVGVATPTAFTVTCGIVLQNEILFLSTRDGPTTEIYVMAPDGTNVRRLTNNTVDDQDVAASPDGRKIAFSRVEGGHFQLYVMNADGTGELKLSTNASVNDADPEWSPDGTGLAFESNRAGGLPEVWIMGADGSNARQLTNDGAENGDVDWSPSGSTIVYECHPNGDSDICVINVNGTGQTNLTDDPAGMTHFNDADPNWSPDGSKIAFGSNRSGNVDVWTMNANGSGATQLTNNAATDQAPTWSPDGTKIAFNSNRDGDNEIFTMDGSTGNSQAAITDNPADDRIAEWSRR